MARKNSNRPTDAEILRSMYPDIPDSEDLVAAEAKKNTKPAEVDQVEAKFAALQAKYDQLEGQIVANRSQRAPMQELVAPVAPAFDLSQAPDPVTDPQGYAQFVRAQTAAQISYERNRFAHEQQVAKRTQTQMDDLWSDFNGRYEAYAANADKVEIATTRLLQRKAAEGIDINQYMYNNRDTFYRDIVKAHDDLFGKPGAAAVTGDDDDDGDDDDNRTTLVSGNAGGNPPPAVKAPVSQYGDLSTSINAWQKATGFHR